MGTAAVRLRIELRDVAPAVWRQFLVPAESSLSELHGVIQDVMGWTNSHLYEFVVRDKRYSHGNPHADLLGEMEDSLACTISSLGLGPGDRVLYTYDFGDGWEHDLTIEEVTAKKQVPLCLAGARACPPEDCGGPPGYAELVAALADPEHPERESFVEWVGREFDPVAFDIAEINAVLARK